MLARYMDESRAVPTATSFRTIAVTTLDGAPAPAQGRRREGVVHPPDRVRDRARRRRAAGDGRPLRRGRRQAVADPRRRASTSASRSTSSSKDGSRTLMVPVIRDAGSRAASTEFLAAYDALVEKARTNTLTADDLAGANITLTNPGGLGTSASVPRLMSGQGTIVATGSIAFPPGLERDRRADRRREGDDADLDLRPPDHPGRGVGALPGAHRCAARRRGRLLRGRLRGPRRRRSSRCRSAPRRTRPRRPARRRPSVRRARSSSRRPRPPTRSFARCARTDISPRRSIRSARRRTAIRRSTRRRSV